MRLNTTIWLYTWPEYNNAEDIIGSQLGRDEFFLLKGKNTYIHFFFVRLLLVVTWLSSRSYLEKFHSQIWAL